MIHCFDYEITYYKVISNDMMDLESNLKIKIGFNILDPENTLDPDDVLESNNTLDPDDTLDQYNDLSTYQNIGYYYFCNLSDVCEWINLYHHGLVCEIRVPEDALICTDTGTRARFRSNQIIVSDPINYMDFIEKHNLQTRVVEQNGLLLEYIKSKDKTRELCIKAMEQNGLALKFVPRQYHDYQMYVDVIKNNGLALKYVFLSILTDQQCDYLFDLTIKWSKS